MKICHVSFGKIDAVDLDLWLESISYHTRVLESLATRHHVISFHYSTRAYQATLGRVEYRFLEFDFAERMFLKKLVADVRLFNPHVLIIHGMHATLNVFRFVRNFSNIRIYIQHHGERTLHWPKSISQRYTDQYINRYFFSAAALGSEWVKAGLIKSHGKIFEVMEATSSFEPEIQLNRGDSSLNFLWVGRINPNKDPDTLIDGFSHFVKKNPTAKLFVIFRESSFETQHLQHKARALASSIIFVGAVDHDQIPGWLNKVNFIISTSLYEGSGIAILEAMSAGCIPIVTNIPSFQTMTGHGKVGILFQPASSETLAHALDRAALLDVETERQNVLDHFNSNLSAEAIAKNIESELLK